MPSSPAQGQLFSESPEPESPGFGVPLAARLRPESFDEVIGHEALLAEHGSLAGVLEGRIPEQSLILWGPPGSGKTTLAQLLSRRAGGPVHHLSAVTAGLAELRQVVAQGAPGQSQLLFLDEIHRFNTTQQDALLPLLESGQLRLIGATTENPYFELRKALLSRCRVIKLDPLTDRDLVQILRRALQHPRGYGRLAVDLDDEVLSMIASRCDGDARAALTLLEIVVTRGSYGSQGRLQVTLEHLQAVLNDQHLAYHRHSDRKYDLTSAFIKSIRGSDPDAALYWLACMLAAGEDPRYLMRRLLISASEDIGLADPSAIAVVTSCAQALEWVGMPEGKYALSQATLYLATAAKSASTQALFRAEDHLRRHGPAAVPNPLRDGTFQGAAQHGIGVGYHHPLHQPEAAASQRYRPAGVDRGAFYQPGEAGYEKVIRQRLEQWSQRARDDQRAGL